MRFGGHQTFSIREGWLFKGMRLLEGEPELFGSEYLQDYLGVGKNMAKAIRHWLEATDLAQPVPGSGSGRRVAYELTDLGRLVWHNDRYMLQPTTWWLLHIQLAYSRRHALTWHWFFNRFTASRFERATVVESLRRFIQITGTRMPSIRTLERDVACMLRSYAEPVPRETGDPEDLLECPFIELGLMTSSRHSGFYRVNRGAKGVPFPVFAYAIARAFGISEDQPAVDVSLTELTHNEGSPGRLFCLSAESLFDMVAGYEASGDGRISILSQAGERIIRIQSQPVSDWLEESLSALSPAGVA